MPFTSCSRRAVGLAIAGGLLGNAIEVVHRGAGVWEPRGGGPVPLWVAPLYVAGLLALFAGLGRLDPQLPRPSRRRALVEATGVAALALAPPLLHAGETLLAGATAGVLLGRLGLVRAPGDAMVALAVMAADLAVEGAMVGAGLYRYAHAGHGPLPLWLAPLWGAMALGLRQLFRLARP